MERPLPRISLDYPGIGPEHSFLKDIGRAEYYAVTDSEALEGFQMLSRCALGPAPGPGRLTRDAYGAYDNNDNSIRRKGKVLLRGLRGRQRVQISFPLSLACGTPGRSFSLGHRPLGRALTWAS